MTERTTVARLLAEAGALLIDIRSETQRDRDGVIPGARFIARNVLEWRCDPARRHATQKRCESQAGD